MNLKDVDKSEFTPMMQQYIECKENYPDAIVFFRIGDFYEMFFEDAYIASRELEIALTGKDAGYKERVPMCGIPFHAYSGYAEKLISKGYKVAIVEQVEDPSQAKGLVKRDVVKIITPGTITEAGLNEKENNFLAAIYETDARYTLAYADVSTGQMYLTTIEDEEALANEILSLHAKEVICLSSLKLKILNTLHDNYQIVISRCDDTSLIDDYKYLIEGLNLEKFKDDIPCISILINYISKTQRHNLYHLQPIKFYSSNQVLHLDPFSKRNLELTETLRQNQKSGSLLWLLDKCQTAMGSRKLHTWIDRPLIDRNEIIKRHNYVEALINNYVAKEEIKESLKTVYDLERIIGRISVGNANAKDLVQLRRSLANIPNFKKNVMALGTDDAISFANGIDTHEKLYDLLDKALVDDPPLQIKEGGMIKPLYNKDLDELKEISGSSKDWILKFEAQERERTGIKTMHVGYNRVFGYYIEVSKGALQNLTDSDHYERKQTLANAERFITPELKKYEQIVVGSTEKIQKLEYDLFIEIRDVCQGFTKSLQQLADKISTIDCLLAFAEVSVKYNYVRPEMSLKREVNIVEGRHPVIETFLKDEYVKNDVIINSYNTILITGPNMSGKSTYMRMLALIVIMAQIGCFVPAKSATLMIFDAIFTRIGASDDLISGQSTFMVEMLEANFAIKNATKDSLILFDELGRGTSTYDGMALAQAIIEYVHEKIGCVMLFSTHYHELVLLDKTLKHLKNVHVDAKESKGGVVFLHKVLDGGADKSYGINVASLAGLPRSLIERSKKILETLEENNSTSGVNLDLFNFDAYEEEPQNQEEEKAYNLKHALEILDIDSLTPREALDWLYKEKNKLD
ncbi:MAG: DNA mismatch repair protein MutS [Clostridium sp. CAG:307_30_263]|nr:MAG: DNA mismatch repair protein MutS [Clostridium sp. CAG:307_30_263]